MENIHEWFGCSRSSFLVIPRVFLEDMSDEWQNKMVELLEEYEDVFSNQPEVGTRVQLTDLDGKLIKTPEEVINYRRPNVGFIKKCKGEEDE